MKATKWECLSAKRLCVPLPPPALLLAILVAALATPALAQSGYQDRDTHSRIAFIQPNAQGTEQDVFTMKPDGTDIQQLTNVGGNNYASWESWSSDGGMIVFALFSVAPGQLWLTNVDGSHQRLLLSEADYFETTPSFSPDGAWIAFTRCEVVGNGNGCAISRIRVDGSGLTTVTQPQLEVNDSEPVYSPDGGTIAFDSFSRDGVLGALYLADSDGSNIRQLTPSAIGAENPHWSPDGEKIVFSSRCCNNPQNADIWIINRDGSGLHRLTGSTATDLDIPVAYYNDHPSWSPRGHAIVFDQYLVSGGANAIYIVGADGTGMMQLIARPAAPRSAAEAERKKHQHMPVEIQQGGFLPRWSPELP